MLIKKFYFHILDKNVLIELSQYENGKVSNPTNFKRNMDKILIVGADPTVLV
jgi:hypothetical protein